MLGRIFDFYGLYPLHQQAVGKIGIILSEHKVRKGIILAAIFNLIPTLFLVMLIYEMLSAVKLGLLRFSTGSVWACIFDHMAFACILDMIHVQHTALDMTVQLDQNYYLRIISYQAIALLMVLVYYIYKKSKIREQASVRHAARHTSHHADHRPEN